MSCTTVLVGKKASNDGSTMIARTDDGKYDIKQVIVVEPKDQPRKYTCKISHCEVDLPEEPLRYTCCPTVKGEHGLWPAAGINSAQVGMSATETITTNPRVLAADPLVAYKKAEKRGEKDTIGGIGEEDFITLVLPYIRSAREGVLRLASLIERYGTYESNGIGFNDENEIWWMETIGGHHWIARKVPDEFCVIHPNQFGTDAFDLDDALGEGKEHLCSKDLREFIEENHLDLNQDGKCNPRLIFGSRRDMDHLYNTPRAWFMGRYLAPRSFKWDGPDADFTPESDDIPWALVPERKVTVEDVKYLLSSHFQGTPYDPYIHRDTGMRGMYRSIGINRTGDTILCQIRPYAPQEIKGLEWIIYGPTTFSAILPLYPNVPKMPKYICDVTRDASTENFYWSSRLINALVDPHFATSIQNIERYQSAVAAEGRRIVLEYDRKFAETKDMKLLSEANEKLAEMAKEKTTDVLNKVLLDATAHMKNGYDLADN